ncbi:MAG TPA: helix-turn-helix domain-containing protein [Thermoanaerobaculia bacterium]|jgi:sugar-specific transcriptional regulator TrmB
MRRHPAETLVALGLTPLEAEVYTVLLQLPSATGYKLAQRVGKPTANVYKALASLADKGAVLIDRGELRHCRAVPAADFIGRLTRELNAAASEAVETLSRPAEEERDEGVYPLRTAAQVEERFAAMIEAAREVLLIDASPDALAPRHDALAAAVRRKTAVAIKAYAPFALRGATVHVDPRAASIRRRWERDWLHVVADGAETLLASLSPDGEVLHAVWTRNAYLTVVYHEALASEIVLAGVAARIEERAGSESLLRLLHHDLRFIRLDKRGFEKLHEKLGHE